MTTKNAEKFHEWMDRLGYTLMDFAHAAGIGHATVALLRGKSRNDVNIVLNPTTRAAIKKAFPDCPLVR